LRRPKLFLSSFSSSTFLASLALAALGASATPAAALDCKKAASALEKAICADPATAAADEAMGQAYTALAARLSDTEKKQLIASQRTWIKQRSDMCMEDKGPSLSCLLSRTQQRAAFLAGRPEAGPGTGHELTPILIDIAGTRKTYERNISLLKFVEPALPGEILFNKKIAKLIADIPVAKDDPSDTDRTYSYELHMRLVYASPRLITAQMENYVYSGGAHGSSGTNNINIDLAKGKVLSFADLFEAGTQKKLSDLCFEQIKAQKIEKSSPDFKLEIDDEKQTRKTIFDDVGNIERWTLGSTEATVTFDAYEVGSYAEGPYSCTFKNDSIQPLLKAGAPWPGAS